mgnify:CR=1 FL=1
MAEAVRNSGKLVAKRIRLRGHVQGVGFRPFVFRLAEEFGVAGYVQNQLGEVEVLAAGEASIVDDFAAALVTAAPPLAAPRIAEVSDADIPDASGFEIIGSAADADAQIFVPPDYFMCDDCRRELHDPADRRHNYPFINCTQCGPRYTLIEALPYDRPNTSMANFPLCPECEAEYLDPRNRRFHAEPVACSACGPQLSFAGSNDALAGAVDAIRAGDIVAVKGIGGYHLVCDACNDTAVARLRERKRRPDKPLAVMFPLAGSDGLDVASRYVEFDPVEAEIVRGPMRPIALATRRHDGGLAPGVAPGLGEIGVFLPYSPLHELLLAAVEGPIVATSGNISGEPVLTDNDEAARRLAPIADAFLQHDRPIVRPADDPVFRRIDGAMRPIRIGRGCAPRELEQPRPVAVPTLAVRGHMKGTLALAWGRRVVVSPHIGEMDSPRSLDVFEQVAQDLQSLYGVQAQRIVRDAHPGYTTHRWAEKQGLPVEDAWHHEAHASAAAAEFDEQGECLVFAWDGVGLGRDGTLWGGEAFLGRPGHWQRFASLRTFRLPGGDQAGREPWRSAASLHWECDLEWNAAMDPDGIARVAWETDINCPTTSAAGRLFDAAAAIICDLPRTSFEAQGPMQLEALCESTADPLDLPLTEDANGVLRSDWQPLLALLNDVSVDSRLRAELFHASMAGAILAQARAARSRHGIARIGLSGGVFQNRFLAEQAIALLAADGFETFLPLALPCNDAALSYGQAAELAAREAH